MAKQRGRRNYTAPELPDRLIVDDEGVRVRHYYANDHAPPHAHVTEGGADEQNETRIGQNGYPLESNPALTGHQQQIVRRNIARIRRAIRKIGRWYWYQQQ